MKTFTGRSYLIKVMLALSAISFTFGIIHSESFAERTEPLIIDHTCTDLSMVPTHWMDQAKAMFKLSYGHTSHGSQIVTGMDLLKDPSGSQNWFDHDGTDGGLSLHDREPSGDLGNPDRTTWATRTQTLLDTSGCDRNMIMWSWCGQVDGTEAEINTYLNLMNGLEVNYPGVTFVYMTGHLNGTGEDGNVNVVTIKFVNIAETTTRSFSILPTLKVMIRTAITFSIEGPRTDATIMVETGRMNGVLRIRMNANLAVAHILVV